MATPHNSADIKDIAPTVLMPGDPLRAEFIAKEFLTNSRLVTSVRNMYGFTGEYKGVPVTVMGHGMGIPSAGIYTYELFNFYNVDSIIRVGSAGGLAEDINLQDIVIGVGACTDSNYARHLDLPGTYAPIADYTLLTKAVKAAENLSVNTKIGNIISTDVFYSTKQANEKWRDMGVLAVEMEAAVIYINAAMAKKKALCICTISDHLFKTGELTVEERQTGFGDMITIALDSIV